MKILAIRVKIILQKKILKFSHCRYDAYLFCLKKL